MVQKKEDLGAFTIPFTIGAFKFSKALCDLYASINLMSFAIYKELGLGFPKIKTMWLLISNYSVKRIVGALYDVLVKVEKLILSTIFYIKL